MWKIRYAWSYIKEPLFVLGNDEIAPTEQSKRHQN